MYEEDSYDDDGSRDPDEELPMAGEDSLPGMNMVGPRRTSTMWGHPLIDETRLAGRIVMDWRTEVMILALICCNALWIAFEIDAFDDDGGTFSGPDAVNAIFTLIFIGELTIRFLAYKRPRFFFTDKLFWHWNVFDTLLVVSMVIETFLLPFAEASGQEVAGLSVFRLMRLLRLARMLRFLPELALMVKALIAALRSVSTTVVLAVGIMYVFAIIMTQWARETNKLEVPYKYFGSIADSFLTLFQILCFDECFFIIRIILRKSAGHGILLLFFIMVVALTVLNMLIGVVCKIVAETNSHERRRLLQVKVSNILAELDREHNGKIPSTEVNNANALAAFEIVGVDDRLLCDALEVMEVESSSIIDVDHFAETINKLLQPPESQDVVLVQRKLDKLEVTLLDLIDMDAKDLVREEKEEQLALTRTADEIEKWVATLAKGVLEVTGGWWSKKTIQEPEERASSVVEAFEVVDIDTLADESITNPGTINDEGPDEVEEPPLDPLAILEEDGKEKRPQLDLELIRLNDAMERLRQRLIRWSASGATSTTSMLETRGHSREFWNWQRTCSDVTNSIQSFQQLTADFLGEVEEKPIYKQALIPGAMVRLQELDVEQLLNGQLAQLKRWHGELNRWSIVMENGQEKFAKPTNLITCPDVAPWSFSPDNDKNGNSTDAEEPIVFQVAK
mmetsp:Transcript_75970/g.180698  ORF Transcript_75970/g.180698 Transcript_75970/m.180698 type:complete len:679 (-) Transcript_75970:33-2069(-)